MAKFSPSSHQANAEFFDFSEIMNDYFALIAAIRVREEEREGKRKKERGKKPREREIERGREYYLISKHSSSVFGKSCIIFPHLDPCSLPPPPLSLSSFPFPPFQTCFSQRQQAYKAWQNAGATLVKKKEAETKALGPRGGGGGGKVNRVDGTLSFCFFSPTLPGLLFP